MNAVRVYVGLCCTNKCWKCVEPELRHVSGQSKVDATRGWGRLPFGGAAVIPSPVLHSHVASDAGVNAASHAACLPAAVRRDDEADLAASEDDKVVGRRTHQEPPLFV